MLKSLSTRTKLAGTVAAVAAGAALLAPGASAKIVPPNPVVVQVVHWVNAYGNSDGTFTAQSVEKHGIYLVKDYTGGGFYNFVQGGDGAVSAVNNVWGQAQIVLVTGEHEANLAINKVIQLSDGTFAAIVEVMKKVP